jgi:hypothetical protein
MTCRFAQIGPTWQRGNRHAGPLISRLNSLYTDDMAKERENANKRDHSKYGYAVRLPLSDREREALRMLAAEKNESQGAVIAEILRKALMQSGWLKPIDKDSQSS